MVDYYYQTYFHFWFNLVFYINDGRPIIIVTQREGIFCNMTKYICSLLMDPDTMNGPEAQGGGRRPPIGPKNPKQPSQELESGAPGLSYILVDIEAG